MNKAFDDAGLSLKSSGVRPCSLHASGCVLDRFILSNVRIKQRVDKVRDSLELRGGIIIVDVLPRNVHSDPEIFLIPVFLAIQ